MWIVIGLALIAVDQLIKWLTVAKLSLVDTLPLINNVFHLTYVENRGAVFGLFQNTTLLLAIITFIEIGVIMYFFIKKTDNSMWIVRSALVMILSGAVGNLIDRVFRGFVVDMFDFRLINFYVFNFADACVCVGVGVLVYYILFMADKEKERLN